MSERTERIVVDFVTRSIGALMVSYALPDLEFWRTTLLLFGVLLWTVRYPE